MIGKTPNVALENTKRQWPKKLVEARNKLKVRFLTQVKSRRVSFVIITHNCFIKTKMAPRRRRRLIKTILTHFYLENL